MTREPYPTARRADGDEILHDTPVADPYRWLEDPDSPETQGWLLAQADLFKRQSEPQRFRDRIAELLRRVRGRARVARRHVSSSSAARRTRSTRLLRRRVRRADGTERTLIDPMALDPIGLDHARRLAAVKEGDLLAYQLSEGGTEESVLRVMDVVTGETVDGPDRPCRYSPIAWLPGGKAYYYVRRLAARPRARGRGAVPPPGLAAPRRHRPRRRRAVFGEGLDKTNYYGVSVSRDGRWLRSPPAEGTAPRNDLWLADLRASPLEAPDLRVVQEGVDANTGVEVGRDGRLYVFTDLDAPRGRVCVTTPSARPPSTGAT